MHRLSACAFGAKHFNLSLKSMKTESFSVSPAASSPEQDKPYVYVLVRTDISLEQQLVQASHAALEAGFRFAAPREVSSVIVLAVPSRDALLQASARLQQRGVDHELFFEPDFGMGHSALATRPLTAKKERHLMRKYPLYQATASHGTGASASRAQEVAHA